MEYFAIYLLVMADRIVASAGSMTNFGFISVLSIILYGLFKTLHKLNLVEITDLEEKKVKKITQGGEFYNHDQEKLTKAKGNDSFFKAACGFSKPIAWVSTFIWFSALFVSATFPNTKQLAAIIGTSFAYNAVSSDSGKAMAKEAYDIIQLHMRNYTDELRKGLEGRRTELKKELIETISEATPTTEGD